MKHAHLAASKYHYHVSLVYGPKFYCILLMFNLIIHNLRNYTLRLDQLSRELNSVGNTFVIIYAGSVALPGIWIRGFKLL
jgi:hypothetical protein